MCAGDVEWCYGHPGEGMDWPDGTKLSPKLGRSWVPPSLRSPGEDHLCAPRSCAGASVLCEKMPGRRKGHFQDSHVLKRKMDGMKPGGGEPF